MRLLRHDRERFGGLNPIHMSKESLVREKRPTVVKREKNISACASYDIIASGLANHICCIDLKREIRVYGKRRQCVKRDLRV